MRAQRLMRERDEEQCGRADHKKEYANVEHERGRHV